MENTIVMNLEWGKNHDYYGDEIAVTWHGGRQISATWYTGRYSLKLGNNFDWGQLLVRISKLTDWDTVARLDGPEPFATLNIPCVVDGPNSSHTGPDWSWAMWEQLAGIEIAPKM